jgi:hypothetical protein
MIDHTVFSINPFASLGKLWSHYFTEDINKVLEGYQIDFCKTDVPLM